MSFAEVRPAVHLRSSLMNLAEYNPGKLPLGVAQLYAFVCGDGLQHSSGIFFFQVKFLLTAFQTQVDEFLFVFTRSPGIAVLSADVHPLVRKFMIDLPKSFVIFRSELP